MRAAECVTFFTLVGGEVTEQCSRNLVLSLKLPSSPWVEALVPTELKDTVMYSPSGGTRTVHPWLHLFLFFFNKFIYYLFIYFWLCWVFVAACGLSLVAASGGYFSLPCAGFSLQWLLLLWSMGSRHVGFSSCGSWAQ